MDVLLYKAFLDSLLLLLDQLLIAIKGDDDRKGMAATLKREVVVGLVNEIRRLVKIQSGLVSDMLTRGVER